MKISLNSQGGRIPMLIIILMIISVFVGAMLIIAKVNAAVIFSIVGIINILFVRYLYLLLGKKPVIYFKKDFIVFIGPVISRRKIEVDKIIEFRNRIVNHRYVSLTVRHFKGKTICETLLAGNIYSYGLDELPIILNKQISKYNQQARKNYEEMSDKTSAIGLFAFSNTTIFILGILHFAISFINFAFILHIKSSMNYISMAFYTGILLLIGILYYKHKIKNIVFQYVYYFFVVYPVIFGFLFFTIKYIPTLFS